MIDCMESCKGVIGTMPRKGKKRLHLARAAGTAIVVAAAAAGWCKWRNCRYPLEKEYRFINNFFIPGSFLSPRFLRFANARLYSMKLPVPPDGIKRYMKWMETRDGERMRLTVYRPSGAKKTFPCLVYFHGGGFCLADAPYLHKTVAEYARQAECAVVLVHYRTSDRYPFPVPFQDCCDGLEYIRRHEKELHLDGSRIAVGGDSAGGALAAACALWSRDTGKADICFQMLIYPVLDCRMETESMRKFTDSPLWNAGLNRKMWQLYLQKPGLEKVEYASPALAENLHKLPDAYIEVEQFDCLHDEGAAFAERLRSAGAAVQLEDVRGTFHGFDVFRKKTVTQKMIRMRILALQRAFQQDSCIIF